MLTSIITHLREKNKYNLVDLTLIHLLSLCPDNEVRNDVAELLCLDYLLWNELTLLRMTFDPNELVRLNAVDSLSIGRTRLSLRRLVKLSYARDELLRGYCLMSIIDIINNRDNINEKRIYLHYVKKRLEKEKSDRVLLMVDSSLYLSGMKSKLTEIVKVVDKQINTEMKDFWLIMNVIDNILDNRNKNELSRLIRDISTKISDKSQIERWKETEGILQEKVCQ